MIQELHDYEIHTLNEEVSRGINVEKPNPEVQHYDI